VAIYISRGCYTADAVRGMMAKPEDRESTIARVFGQLGGKLLSYYVTLGEYDWLIVSPSFRMKRLRPRVFLSQWRAAVSPMCRPPWR
jgi:GYD domain